MNFSTIRHFVLPGSGDLLISSVSYRDAKHRYRCQIRHQITNHRQYSQSWAHILFKSECICDICDTCIPKSKTQNKFFFFK